MNRLNPRTRAVTGGRVPARMVAFSLIALIAIVAAAPEVRADDLAAAAADTVRLSVVPDGTQVQAGDTLLVELTVPEAGPAFNGYDAYLMYDPAVLQFLPAANVTTQEGPLMTTACGLRFHVFTADTLAGRLRVSHSLLCAGRSVTGPGVVYRVRLRARAVDADTPLTLLMNAPNKTTFYLAGTILVPLQTAGALVRVGAGSAAAAETPRVGLPQLRVTPNPFNPLTVIAFRLENAARAVLRVHDARGRVVATLVDRELAAGDHQFDFDGRGLPSGLYLCRLEADGAVETRKMTLLR